MEAGVSRNGDCRIAEDIVMTDTRPPGTDRARRAPSSTWTYCLFVDFLAFLAFFSIQHYATGKDDHRVTASLHGFSGAAVSYRMPQASAVSPLSSCCGPRDFPPFRGVTFIGRQIFVRRLGASPATRLFVQFVSPTYPYRLQYRRPRGTLFSFWMSARDTFDPAALHTAKLPLTAKVISQGPFEGDSIGFTTWAPIYVADYGPTPVAAWLPVTESVLSLQHFRPRGKGLDPYFYLREEIAKPHDWLGQRRSSSEYPSLDLSASDVIIWSEPYRDATWARINAFVIQEQESALFLRLAFAPASEPLHNGAFFNDLSEIGTPSDLSFELMAWHSAAAVAEYSELLRQERQRQAAIREAPDVYAHDFLYDSPWITLPPLSGCDVYGPVRQAWFPGATGTVAGTGERAEIRIPSNVKLTATSVHVAAREPLLSLDYGRATRAVMTMGGDTDVRVDESRALAPSPLLTAGYVVGKALVGALLASAAMQLVTMMRTHYGERT
jgi:hypothetical protein